MNPALGRMMRRTSWRTIRVIVLLRVGFVVALLAYLIWQVHVQVTSKSVKEVPLSVAYATLCVQSALILGELLVSSVAKQKDALKRSFSSRAIPLIRNHFAMHLAGEDRLKPLRQMCLLHGADVQLCAGDFLSAVEGPARERLSALATALGLRWLWERTALVGSDQDRKFAAHRLGQLGDTRSSPILRHLLTHRSVHVQTAACRALIALGQPDDIAHAFLFSLETPLLVPAMLVADLEPHAFELAGRAFEQVRLKGSEIAVVTALELFDCWLTALPMAQLVQCLLDPRTRVRAAAMKLLRHHDPDWAETWIMAGLVDQQEPVRVAAMQVSADLKLAPAVPTLALAITTGTFVESMQALEALASISDEGRLITERAITSTNRHLAARAAEALSGARLDRAEAMV